MKENCVCCSEVLEIDKPYYLTRRDLRGETFSEWYKYLANLYNDHVTNVYKMFEEFKKEYCFKNMLSSAILTNKGNHALNYHFEQHYISLMKEKKGLTI